ncbi:hypothetical protein [Maricaulis sp.]|uniref:hypothetical protein n=1 Tax=Maricaulis sp. TaxID=1486257 RepID=UPI003A8E58AD
MRTSRDTASAPDHERGSALIAAVALTVVFASLAILTIQLVLNSAFLERSAINDAKLDAALRTSFAEALYQASSGAGAVGYDEPITTRYEVGTIEARFRSPSGRLDINAASPLLLRLVFDAAGAADADALAAALADWRDGDDLRANRGAEGAEYEALGLAPPANRPFRDEAELAQVLGITDAVLDCIRGEVTVSTHAAAPDLRFATPWLRAALNPGSGQRSSVIEAEATVPRLPSVTFSAGDLLALDLRVVEGPATGRAIAVLIRFTGDPRDPFWIQDWQDAPGVPVCPAVTT